MINQDEIRYKASDAVFKIAEKTKNTALQRHEDEKLKGKGWIEQANMPMLKCRPDKLLESIEYYKIAYEIRKDPIPPYRIAYVYETLGDKESAKKYFSEVIEICDELSAQTDNESNLGTYKTYKKGANEGLSRN